MAPELSLSARRNGVRAYTFTGRVLPARNQVVSLVRTGPAGRRALTSRARVRPDGTYQDRRFGGTGLFGFTLELARSATNAAGTSRVRSTLVH